MSEAHWSFFLPLGDEVSLLELGPGSGDRGCRLAQRSGRVNTLCMSEDRAKLVEAQSRRAGVENLHSHLHRPGADLEFEDGGFDAVLVARLLNYPASYGGKTNPEQAALRLLIGAHRVLSPSGLLCVGAENRTHHALGLATIVGSLRKSTPRVDEDLELDLQALGNDRSRFRLSLDGYRGLLRSAGFVSVRAFAPLPDGVRPEVVVSLDDPGPQQFLFRRRVRRHSAKTRAAAALGEFAANTGLLPRVAPFFYLVASK